MPDISTPQKPNYFKIWWIASRPRTLPAAMSGVIAGTALAITEGTFHLLPTLAALLVALFLQIGSNVANDVYDFELGADSEDRQGPQRVTQSGLLAPAQIKIGMWVIFFLAALCGLYLAAVSSWWLIPIGAAAILSAILYTTGPYPLGYHGLGELFVFIFFGPAAVTGTFFVQARHLTPASWLMSIPLGLLIVGILVVNNLRDFDQDRLAGKHTLAARFGSNFAKSEYLACIAVAYLSIPIFCLASILPWSAMFTWLSLPLALSTIQIVFTQTGKTLNLALARTGQTALLFSLLFLAQAIVF